MSQGLLLAYLVEIVPVSPVRSLRYPHGELRRQYPGAFPNRMYDEAYLCSTHAKE